MTPARDVGLADKDGSTWSHFVTRFSGNDAVPGEPGAEDRPIQPLDMASRALRLLLDFHRAVATPTGSDRIYVSGSPAPRSATSDWAKLVRGAGLTALAALLEAVERGARLATGAGLEYRFTDHIGAFVDGRYFYGGTGNVGNLRAGMRFAF